MVQIRLCQIVFASTMLLLSYLVSDTLMARLQEWLEMKWNHACAGIISFFHCPAYARVNKTSLCQDPRPSAKNERILSMAKVQA